MAVRRRHFRFQHHHRGRAREITCDRVVDRGTCRRAAGAEDEENNATTAI